jgi:DtxR family Mn-dependent transcriptional regulator
MPDEERSVASRLLRRLFRARTERPAANLAELPVGSRRRIERLEGEPGLLARLTAQGLVPGVTVHVVQRVPTFVIEVGETTIALERRVAEGIHLRPS